jgi:hypothetical protein
MPLGSPAHEFFTLLARSAEASIKEDMARYEEEESE